MKRSALIILLTLFAGCACANIRDSDVNKFKEGNRLLLNGNNDGALNFFNQLVSANIKSPELYSNIAFAYYKDKKYGECIAWYQKAMLLAPHDRQLLYNISVVEGKLKKNGTLFSPSAGISMIVADNLLAISTGLLTLAGLLFLGLTLFLPHHKKISKSAATALFIVPATAFLLLCGLLVYKQNQQHVVITGITAAVRMGPSGLAKQVAELNEGDYIETKNYYNGWFEIQLTNGSDGWIFNKDVEKVEDK